MRVQRGRRSAASFEIQPTLPGQRPEPPAELTAEEAKEWVAITNKMPVDWFPREQHPLLVELVQAIVMSRRLAAEIAASASLGEAEKPVKLKLQIAHTIAAISTKLRLTNQSRYGKRTAERLSEKTNQQGRTRPWEVSVPPNGGSDTYAWGQPDDEV
jgi:hypothetical protein